MKNLSDLETNQTVQSDSKYEPEFAKGFSDEGIDELVREEQTSAIDSLLSKGYKLILNEPVLYDLIERNKLPFIKYLSDKGLKCKLSDRILNHKNFREYAGQNLDLDTVCQIVNLGTDEAIQWFAEILNNIDYTKFIGHFNQKNVIGKNIILFLLTNKKFELIKHLLAQVKNPDFILYLLTDFSIPPELKEVVFRRGLDLRINFIKFLDAPISNLPFKVAVDELLKRKFDNYHCDLIKFLFNKNRIDIRKEINEASSLMINSNEDKNIENYKFLSSIKAIFNSKNYRLIEAVCSVLPILPVEPLRDNRILYVALKNHNDDLSKRIIASIFSDADTQKVFFDSLSRRNEIDPSYIPEIIRTIYTCTTWYRLPQMYALYSRFRYFSNENFQKIVFGDQKNQGLLRHALSKADFENLRIVFTECYLNYEQFIETLVILNSHNFNNPDQNKLISMLIKKYCTPKVVIRVFTRVMDEIKDISKHNRLVSVISQLSIFKKSMDVREVSIEILGSVLMKASSVNEVMGIVNQLEHPNNYESLRFLQDRQSTLRMGSYGYTCNGREVTTSWIKIMRIAQECILKLAKKNQNLPHDPKVVEFLGKCTSRIQIGVFTSMVQEYEKVCLPVIDSKKADHAVVNLSKQSLKPIVEVGAQTRGPQTDFFKPHFSRDSNEENLSEVEILNNELG